MKYYIHADRLVMTADETEREALKSLRADDPDKFGSDDAIHDALENMVTNDCFFWIDPALTGDLTSAPMLAILGDEEDAPAGYDADQPGSGLYLAGNDGTRVKVMPVLYRWAFMDYAVRSPLDDLADKGEAVWQGGVMLDRPGQTDLTTNVGEVNLICG